MKGAAMTPSSYIEIPYPSSRKMTFDLGRIFHKRHYVTALLEIDVTSAWESIRAQPRNEERFSFIAWLIKAVADSVAEYPEAAAFNQPRHGRVMVFEDVDISIVIEKEVQGSWVPLPYVVRAAQTKTPLQIHRELEAAKAQTVVDEGGYVLGEPGQASLMKAFLVLPQWLRLWFMKTFLLDHPRRMQASMGSVAVTTVGMVGHTHGWIVPTTMHPLCLAFGSINEQPRVVKEKVEVRRILHLTTLVDHDAVDGAPAARFMDGLVRRLEAGE
jgi:pyruvate/2-oxoglutarate dehydrogenase complex dihydrolipoamide acyltransferase (E2) component